MFRRSLVATLVLALSCAGIVSALDGKDKKKDKAREELRAKILKEVEERLNEENKRVMEEVKKILDEELAKLDEEEAPKKEPPKKEPPKKEPPKKEPPKKEPPKKHPGSDQPGYLGVYPDDLKEGMRALLKLKEGEGVLLVGVAEEGPAAKAGVKANDIVLAVDGQKVGSTDELRNAVMAHHAGESVKLSVLRKKEKLEIEVTLAERTDIEPGEGDEGEGDEGEGDEEKPATKKPKVVFEPRAETPEFDEKSEQELREETRKFLEETLKKEKSASPKKSLIPSGTFQIGDEEGDEGGEGAEEGDEGEGEEDPQATPGPELRELTKRFLKDLLDRLEKQDDSEDFNFDEELKKMKEKFDGFRQGEMEQLKEQLQQQMEKLKDGEYLKKLLEGMDPEALQEQLKGLLGKGQADGPDEEDLTQPDEQKNDPKPEPRAEPRRASKVWLGVAPEEMSAEMRKQLKLESGVVIREVIEGSPAAEAGLKEGDILTALDGEDLASPDALRSALSGLKAGSQVTLTIYRKGKTIEKTVTLVERKKIAVPSKLLGPVQPIGDERGKKSKKSKKPVRKEKKAVLLDDGSFDPMKLGMEFGKSQGWKLGVIDKKGKVIFSAPFDRMGEFMKLAQQFGVTEGKSGKFSFGKEGGKVLELLQGGRRDGKKAGKGRDDDDEDDDREERADKGHDKKGCEDGECPHEKGAKKQGRKHAESRKSDGCPLQDMMKKFHGGKGPDGRKMLEMFEKHVGKGGDFRKMLERGGKGLDGRKMLEMFEKHVGKGGDFRKMLDRGGKGKTSRKQVQEKKTGKAKKSVEKVLKLRKPGVEKHEFRFDLPKGTRPGDIRKQLEKAFKGGKMPAELREELKKLERELDRMQKKNGKEKRGMCA